MNRAPNIPDDRLDIQCLLQAMQDFIDAKHRHDNPTDIDGYSWIDIVGDMNRAADAFGKRLDEYVDARIEAVLINIERPK